MDNFYALLRRGLSPPYVLPVPAWAAAQQRRQLQRWLRGARYGHGVVTHGPWTLRLRAAAPTDECEYGVFIGGRFIANDDWSETYWYELLRSRKCGRAFSREAARVCWEYARQRARLFEHRRWSYTEAELFNDTGALVDHLTHIASDATRLQLLSILIELASLAS